jgi:superfamily II DNA or RNA helicase
MMNDQIDRSNQDQELDEFRTAERERKVALAFEEEAFIDTLDDQVYLSEDKMHVEKQDAPIHIIADESARRQYWEAEGFVALEQGIFNNALAEENVEHQRNAYFRLAVYHGRTQSILRSALKSQKEPLAQAAMRNLATLHRAMMVMHKKSPHNVPVAMVLDRHGRDEFVRDLVMRTLKETAAALDLERIIQRVNDMDVMDVAKGIAVRHLKNLIDTGHVEIVGQRPTQYRSSQRVYTEMDLDGPSLRSLVGDETYRSLNQEGFQGLNDVLMRQVGFREAFTNITGFDETSAALFIDLVKTLLEDWSEGASHWNYSDLIGSPYPRPYQYEAYAVFRGYGYHGQLVEAPTGSGKTMIGMMCIQDWLQAIRTGQSILILVPTSNYLQQWTGELCYKPIGLRLSPEMVFAGTPNQLERFQKRTGSHPAVLLMTYTALAQAGSGVGKGGFDIDSIEMFMQGANVQYVVLDEVHKVAENLKSVSSDVIRLMLEWLDDSSLQGLIGFTGTAEAYRSRFTKLGLDLVYSIPIDELIAAGFVAPFAELGTAFSYSDRERQIRKLLDEYKSNTRAFMDLIGGKKLREWFAEIPMEERVSVGYDLLNMYKGKKDWETALPKRLAKWEKGGDLHLTETKMVTLIQIIRNWSDEQMIEAADVDREVFFQLVEKINAIRSKLTDLIYIPSTLTRLNMQGFATQFDRENMQRSFEKATNQSGRNEAVKDGLATTIVGLYEGLSEWYRRIGEGRVETIKAIIEAERATRKLTGTIIFDKARRVDWKGGVAVPGYDGLGGLFAQLLGDDRFTPFAILSSEQYLPYHEQDPLPPKIADYIEKKLMQDEIAIAMFDLIFQGLDSLPEIREDLRNYWLELILSYTPRLKNVHAVRPGGFRRFVLRPMRKRIRKAELGNYKELLLTRLDLRNIHFADLVYTFFDYAIIARYNRKAKIAELEQVSGARQKFFVIPMPGGSRKLLMYDLTSRIVDEESLPVNIVIVSSWARTGWNVIKPNLLIDATATRDVTAWQQLRGRAIRAKKSWTNDCYRLVLSLIGSQMSTLEEQDYIPDDVTDTLKRISHHQPGGALDEKLLTLLYEVTTEEFSERIRYEGLSVLSDQERLDIAIALMRRYNKVTHIYELVKAYGSTSQVQFNRAEQVWERRPQIAEKHQYETSVSPLSGQKFTGIEHAPLLYVEDPRVDLPSDLEDYLQRKIEGSDERIVSGWMKIGYGNDEYINMN